MRFFPGSTAMGWLAETPSCLVQACITMLPRLEAEEAIGRVNTGALASGHFDEASAKAYVQSLHGAVTPAAETFPRTTPDPAATLTSMGFAVRRIKKKRAA